MTFRNAETRIGRTMGRDESETALKGNAYELRRLRIQELAALAIKEIADTVLQNGPLSVGQLLAIRDADGTIRISSRRSSAGDEDALEWMQYVTVKPDNTIEMGEVNLEGMVPDQLLIPVMKPFTIGDAGEVASVARQLRHTTT